MTVVASVVVELMIAGSMVVGSVAQEREVALLEASCSKTCSVVECLVAVGSVAEGSSVLRLEGA